MSSFQTVCKFQDLRADEGKTVSIGNKLIAIFLVDGKPYAIDDVCPHMGASLAGGYVDGVIVTCPWHAWRFRVTDGVWADNPRVKIGCYAVRVEGDDVQIQVDQPPKVPQATEKPT